MKIIFPLIAIGLLASCGKKEVAPNDKQNTTFTAQSGIEDTLKSYWRCADGDTLFKDTLVLKLNSISFSKNKHEELLFFLFNYPVWNNQSLICNKNDYLSFTQLVFTNEQCKSVQFVKVNKQ